MNFLSFWNRVLGFSCYRLWPNVKWVLVENLKLWWEPQKWVQRIWTAGWWGKGKRFIRHSCWPFHCMWLRKYINISTTNPKFNALEGDIFAGKEQKGSMWMQEKPYKWRRSEHENPPSFFERIKTTHQTHTQHAHLSLSLCRTDHW